MEAPSGLRDDVIGLFLARDCVISNFKVRDLNCLRDRDKVTFLVVIA